MSVLIVEDDEGVRQSLGDVLRQEGYTVESACDGVQALDRLQREPLPSLIVFDLMMPGWMESSFGRDNCPTNGSRVFPSSSFPRARMSQSKRDY